MKALLENSAGVKNDPKLVPTKFEDGFPDLLGLRNNLPSPSAPRWSRSWFSFRQLRSESSASGTRGRVGSLDSHLQGMLPSIPYCLRLQDAADRQSTKLEDRGCPDKYYIRLPGYSLQDNVSYKRYAGDDSFGVWFPTDLEHEHFKVNIDNLITLLQDAALQEHGIYSDLIVQTVTVLLNTDLKSHLESLDAFIYAAKLFAYFPEATVDLSVIRNPLHLAKWAQPAVTAFPNLGRAFSCLAMFETGTLNIDPSELKNTMAMSAGSSLFMAQYLLGDPADMLERATVQRTIGNIGRPGISFLISAQVLEALEPDYSSWKSVPYAPYDGKADDSFSQTTLHLAFTGYERPLNIGETGYRHKEVFVVEAVIRAYDRTRWVVDLDLAKTFRDPAWQFFIHQMGGCSHSEEEQEDYSLIQPLTSIDSWDELLDLPHNACVVRARGNWLARQAIAAYSVQQQKPLVVTSERLCWKCIADSKQDLLNLLIIS